MTALHRPEWSLPALDAFNRDWFTSGRIAVQQCSACATLQHPPEEICAACGSTTFTSRTLAPTGTVYSFTIVHHAANGRGDHRQAHRHRLQGGDGVRIGTGRQGVEVRLPQEREHPR